MKQLKTLLPILKEFTVRVDEKMRVLSKPEFSALEALSPATQNQVQSEINKYNNALELVQMTRRNDFDSKVKEYWMNNELFAMGENYGQRNAEIIGSIYKYLDFAKLPPKLEYYIPCKDGKPLEEPDFTKWEFDEDGKNPEFDKIMEEYQTALARTIFYGWEAHNVMDICTSIICNDVEMLFYKGRVVCVTDRNQIAAKAMNINTLEDAFISCPHYIELNKLS